MSEDEQIRRLISDDLAHAADGDGAKMLAAVDAGRRRRGASRAFIVAGVVVAMLAALAIVYALAARVLPPLRGTNEVALLWAPVAVVGMLIIGATWIAVSAALSVRR